MIFKLALVALAAVDVALAAPSLRQATRDQVVRLSQTRESRRRALPIACGDGQQFALTYNVTGSAYDGMYAVVGEQPDYESSSYTMQGIGSTIAEATLFTLDANCDLVTSDDRHANVYDYDTSTKFYFDQDGGYGGVYPTATCSITTSNAELQCTGGSYVVKDSFAVCESVSPSTYFYEPPIPGNCLPATLYASVVVV